MFDWMSQRGKNAWILMLFFFSMTMPTILPSIQIMIEADKVFGHPCGVVGFLYLGLTTFGIFFLWDKFYFKKKEQKGQGGISNSLQG